MSYTEHWEALRDAFHSHASGRTQRYGIQMRLANDMMLPYSSSRN